MAFKTEIDAVVKTGASPSGLSTSDEVFCNSVSLRLNDYSTANLYSHYGQVVKHGEANFRTQQEKDLKGQFTSIEVEGESVFIGVIGPQNDAPEGSDLKSKQGTTHYTAYSFDYLLDKCFVGFSFLDDDRKTRSIFSFNGQSSVIEKNKSAKKNLFSWEDDAVSWTTLDIVNYLLEHLAPSEYSWALTGDFAGLENITPNSFDPKGKSLLQCLRELIRPAEGFAFDTIFDGDPKIRVCTTTENAISLDGNLLVPANSRKMAIRETINTDRFVSDLRIQNVEQSAFSKIRIHSEPVRVMATFKLGTDTGGLKQAWTQALEDEYNALTNEADFKEDKYESVFCSYRFSKDWDFMDHNGNPVIPVVDEKTLEVTLTSDKDKGVFIPEEHVLDNQLPLKEDETALKPEFRKPLLLLKDANGNLVACDKAPVRMGLDNFDESMGVKLRSSTAPHIHGKTKFTGTSEIEDYYNQADSLLTTSFYTDSILVHDVDGLALSNGQERIADINLPGYHVWVASKDTHTGTSDKVTEELKILRDDRPALKNFGAMLKSWYGIKRNTLSFSFNRIDGQFHDWVGKMITEIRNSGVDVPVGTICNAVDYDFLGKRVSISTDFKDLNVKAIGGRSYQNSAASTARRVSRLENKTRGIPVRQAPGGEAAASNAFLCVVQSISETTIMATNIDNPTGTPFLVSPLAHQYDNVRVGATIMAMEYNAITL